MTSVFELYPDKADRPSTDPLRLCSSAPFRGTEADYNILYVKVRIPRRSAPNHRARDSTKKTAKMADLT